MRSTPDVTYTFPEVVDLVIKCDNDTLEILASVVSEERACYCLVDLKCLEWIFNARRKELQKV